MGTKQRVIWVLTTLEVWSKLWVSVVVGPPQLPTQFMRVILLTLQRGIVQHRFLLRANRPRWL